MRHMIIEMWRRPHEPQFIDALITSPAFGVPREPIPLFDAIAQRVVLNDGENRVSVLVYERAIEIDEIKRVARVLVDRCS